MTTTTDLATTSGNQAPALVSLTDQAKGYAARSRSENTVRAYQSDMTAWSGYCASVGVSPDLPANPGTVANWVATMGGTVAPATIRRRLVTLSQAHKMLGLASPTAAEGVRTVLKGVLREHGTAQAKAKPVRAANVRAFVTANAEGSDMATVRDRALVLLGFFGAFRRSELASVTVADLQFTSEGVTVIIRRSKTDQAGAGRSVGVCRKDRADACPVRALQLWLEASGINDGPVFRKVSRSGRVGAEALTGAGIAHILKSHAAAFGLEAEGLSGHSLRRGFVTEAYAADVPTPAIQAVTGHRSLQVLNGYYAEANQYRNATATVTV